MFDKSVNVYTTDYEGSSGRYSWVVKGPATYIIVDGRDEAYKWAARLNNAFLLGQATQLFKEVETENGDRTQT